MWSLNQAAYQIYCRFDNYLMRDHLINVFEECYHHQYMKCATQLMDCTQIPLGSRDKLKVETFCLEMVGDGK